MPEQPAPLDAALDRLYGSDPSEFVSVRKQLASDLRATGDKEAAKSLGTARRPTTSAWALNQVARQHPHLVEALLERSRDLLTEQTRPATGDREALRGGIRAHREALEAATNAALVALGTRANDSFRGEIVSMLRAASTDTEVGRSLRLGRLVRDNDSSPGFPEAVGLTLVPSPSGPITRAERNVARRNTAREPASRARERAASAKHEAEQKADRARRDVALRDAADAEADATRAAELVEQLRAELDAARRQLRDAQARSRQSRTEAARLSARLDEPTKRAAGPSDRALD